MAPIFAIIRYALLETFFCIPILPKTSKDIYLINLALQICLKQNILSAIPRNMQND